MSNTNDDLRSFFGFINTAPDNTFSCVGCSINLSEFNNFLIHRQGCRWMRAILFLLTHGSAGECNEFLFR